LHLVADAHQQHEQERTMPKTQTEDDKKHGDKLKSLIDRAGGDKSPPGEESDDDPADLRDDEDEDEDVENDDDDDADDRRDAEDRD
jgi:hypothetical protein